MFLIPVTLGVIILSFVSFSFGFSFWEAFSVGIINEGDAPSVIYVRYICTLSTSFYENSPISFFFCFICYLLVFIQKNNSSYKI